MRKKDTTKKATKSAALCEFDKRWPAKKKEIEDEFARINERSRRVEELFMDKKLPASTLYALGSLLVELSSESGVSVQTPGVAGIFYQFAALATMRESEPRYSLKTCLRHLNILLEKPTASTANKIMKFWDGSSHLRPGNDPFPETSPRRKAVRHA